VSGTLADRLPEDPSGGAVLDAFLAWCAEQELDLYPHQEEAILELFDGSNVVLSTPTGSGKSLVALALHAASLAAGRRSWYTAPVKALVSEKFFALCRDLGPDNVGLITGDATVNPEAPVICATAEILAGMALRHGAEAPVDDVVMDEFHYYGDPGRGVAWQIPLVTLSRARFLLLSATLGPVDRFLTDLRHRTGRRSVEIGAVDRPVPLDFTYRETPLLDSVAELVASGRTPVYVVHFTQAAATEQAQALLSVPVTGAAERKELGRVLAEERFSSPFGKELRRALAQGVGIHHAGMLPRYRLLVERLAQAGLLRVVCGTDTLGVGVNIPIRTVLFARLCKYDGSTTRVLDVREFHQIAGRAGRKGFDTEGSVWVQAPEHVVENRRLEERAATDPSRRRKLVRRKAPEHGYAPWNEDTMQRLLVGRPEPLRSRFEVTPTMVLEVLDRPGDGCAALRALLRDNHEPRDRQRLHARRAIAIFRSLRDESIIEILDHEDDLGRRVRVNTDLQAEFRLNQPLSPFVVSMIESLDPETPEYALDVLSVVESSIDNPQVVLRAQQQRARDELYGRLRAEGVEYEERQRLLAEVTWPKPLEGLLYDRFGAFRRRHPWVAGDTVRPKSVARALRERSLTFGDFVVDLGLRRSEGVLLRYLTEVYRALVQTVPDNFRTEELDDLTDWLGALVRGVDSSLLDEWERLLGGEGRRAADTATAERSGPVDVVADRRGFRALVRSAAFGWVIALTRGDRERLPAWAFDAAAPYLAEFGPPPTDPGARGPAWFDFDESTGAVLQILLDPDESGAWCLRGHVDVDASRASGTAVLVLDAVEER